MRQLLIALHRIRPPQEKTGEIEPSLKLQEVPFLKYVKKWIYGCFTLMEITDLLTCGKSKFEVVRVRV